ncbi:MAG: hypothetical protein F6J95_027660 [Leptolyngbya sp. SIO1E4]|nr:hypothetical protein [Leptolyngbya sp. SIO1E4]
MKKFTWRRLQQGVILGLAAASLGSPAFAELVVSPESVIIAGDRTRQITTTLLFSDDEGIPALKAAVSDLRRVDGAAFIPADKIGLNPIEIAVPDNAPAQVTITVNLSDASSNGDFAGSLYFYHDDARQVVSITVRVKAAPGWPWGVMIVGVLLGTGLSIYRSEGRLRDEIIVQVSRLHNQMRGDETLDKDFKTSIESELIDVSSALEDKDWEAGKAEVLEARNLWTRWKKYREDWVTQLRDGEQLIAQRFDRLAATVKSNAYMREVSDYIDLIYRKLRTGQYEFPQALKDDFAKLREQLFQYEKGNAIIKHLKDMRSQARFSKERETYWINELRFLEARLQNLSPNGSNFQTWEADLENARQALEIDITNLMAAEADQTGTRGIAGRSFSTLVLPATSPGPGITIVAESEQISKAHRNLRWANKAGQAVSVIFLAWLGMIELYAGNATFGAEPMQDYFALLAWGFGAELTRESVVRAAQDLGVSLTK